ncbi:unnamed protein product [Nippostrongylus brasiliensis]|uniref:Paired domain-containing protein n=1 Tax=Nippostrongylus brasiliensis TaxID=27835 RepID=A0A158R2W6_NIPBR|nr:unnamed protein product [Nippostrongylus brasiliensis]
MPFPLWPVIAELNDTGSVETGFNQLFTSGYVFMTPLDALSYSQFLFYNALDLTAPAFLPYQLAQPISHQQTRFHSPQLLTADSTISDRNKQGRAYNPGRPLSMTDRERILQLYENGHKISHIARIIGVTHSCVSKIMTRYRRTGSMYPRSYSTSVLTSRPSSDLSESASDCSSSTISEEWTSAEFTEKTEETPSIASATLPLENLQNETPTTTTPTRPKISGYSIER